MTTTFLQVRGSDKVLTVHTSSAYPSVRGAQPETQGLDDIGPRSVRTNALKHAKFHHESPRLAFAKQSRGRDDEMAVTRFNLYIKEGEAEKMKIYSFPFALTIESSLTIAEIELLQKHDPRALALREVVPGTGEEVETFRMAYDAHSGTGSVTNGGIVFVGETENGKAGMSILIPANLKGPAVGDYINDRLANISNNVRVVEINAAEALVNVKKAKEAFLSAIVPLAPRAVKEAKKDETPAPASPAPKGGKK